MSGKYVPRDDDEARRCFQLAELVEHKFRTGASIEEAIDALTLEAMKLSFEPALAERLIQEFYSTCLEQQTEEQAIARLVSLDPLRYEKARKTEAKRLGLRVQALDRLVEHPRGAAAPAAQGAALDLKLPEPWPEPLDGAPLLDELTGTFKRFVVLPPGAADALALWVLFAYLIDCFDVAPRLAVLSPEMRSGKTTLLRVLARLVPRPLLASNVTPAALFRVVEAARPSLLIDEMDSFVRHNEQLRGILNSGHERDAAYVLRCEGEDNEPRRFSTWAAIAMAAIRRLPATWQDRSIIVAMKRKHPNEHIDRLTRAKLAGLGDLARKCARWTLDHIDALKNADPAIPLMLDDRAADNWRPLLAIADAAGGAWPKSARAAALVLSEHREEAEDSLRVRLLVDIKTVFEPTRPSEIGASELCEALCAIEAAPWATVSRGRPLTPARLARMLKGFGISAVKTAARNVYRTADFDDAFPRYVPASPVQSSIVPQTLGAVRENQLSEVPSANSDGTLKNADSLTESKPSGTMELSNPGSGVESDFDAAVEVEI